jgi:quercetin dioxygenase-like cupin family protein
MRQPFSQESSMAAPFPQEPVMPKTMNQPNDHAELGVGNGDKSVGATANDDARPLPAYVLDRSVHRLEPGLLFKHDLLRAAIEELGGAHSIVIGDPFRPFHMRGNVYVGITTAEALSEVFHFHQQQTEIFCVLDGMAEVASRWAWATDDDWQHRVVKHGDIIIMQPEVCHYWKWVSETGFAAVFKAPIDPAGVGRPGLAGKTTCAFCPYVERCRLPRGYSRPD